MDIAKARAAFQELDQKLDEGIPYERLKALLLATRDVPSDKLNELDPTKSKKEIEARWGEGKQRCNDLEADLMDPAKNPDKAKVTKTKIPTNQPGVSIEKDAAMNTAADEAIRIYMNGPWDYSDKSDHGIPKTLVHAAGKALANRYCFAINCSDGPMTALITPILHYKDNGCDTNTGPIRHLLPTTCDNVSDASWEFYDKNIKTPLDAAKELQRHGFFWDRKFQNEIDPSLTKDLKDLEQKTPKAAPAQTKVNTRTHKGPPRL